MIGVMIAWIRRSKEGRRQYLLVMLPIITAESQMTINKWELCRTCFHEMGLTWINCWSNINQICCPIGILVWWLHPMPLTIYCLRGILVWWVSPMPLTISCPRVILVWWLQPKPLTISCPRGILMLLLQPKPLTICCPRGILVWWLHPMPLTICWAGPCYNGYV